MIVANNSLELKNLSLIFYHQIVYYSLINFVLMVLQVSSPEAAFISKIQQFELLSFHSA